MYEVNLSADRAARPPSKSNWNSLRQMATLIAVDPGGTTGWTLMDVVPDALTDPDVMILDNIRIHQYGQVDCGSTKGNLGTSTHSGVSTTGEAAGISDMLKLFVAWPGSAIVIEDFIPHQFNQSRDFLSPVRIGSVLEWWCVRNGRSFFVQQASEAKTTATDARLKAWKGESAPRSLFIPGNELRHSRDAVRHAITFLRKCKGGTKKSMELRERAWPHLYSEGRPYAPKKAVAEEIPEAV